MFNIKKIILTLAFILSAFQCRAQVNISTGAFVTGDFSVSTAAAIYGGSNYSYGYNIAVDSMTAGGPFIYVRGQSGSENFILKYSGAGVLVTSVTLPTYYDGSWVNYNSMTTDYAGRVYAVGGYWDSVNSRQGLLLIRYNANLATPPAVEYSSTTSLGSIYVASPFGVVPAANSVGLYFAGDVGGKMALLRYDGTEISSTAVLGTNGSSNGVGVDGTGKVYLIGNNNSAAAVFKFDSSLNYISSATLPVALSSAAYTHGGTVNQAGEIFLLASADNGTNQDCVVYKIANMTYVSSTTFDSGGYDMCSNIAVSSDSQHLYLTGSSQNNGNGDYLTVKLDTDLNFETFYTMDGGGYDNAYSVAVDSANNVYVTGNSDRYDGYSYVSNIATIKYAATGSSNRVPALYWAGPPGYEWNGVLPAVGLAGNPFFYRVRYTDPDGDAPGTDYPKVHIVRDGVEIFTSSMTLEGGPSFVAGKTYRLNKALPAGNNYSYHFEAQDEHGAEAIGYPVTNVMYGPRVGLGFGGGFNQPGGLVFDNGGYIEAKAVAVDTITANGPYIYTLGVTGNMGGAMAMPAGNTGGAMTAGATAGVSGDYLILKSSGSGLSTAMVHSSTSGVTNTSYGTPTDLALDSGGNVYTLGGFMDNAWMPAMLVNKFSKNLVWQSSAAYTLAENPRPVAFAIDVATNIYVLGSAMDQDVLVAKYNRDLVLVTTVTFRSSAAGGNTPTDIAVDKTGKVFITGYYNDMSGANSDTNWVTTKFDSSLVFISSAVFDGMGQTSYDMANSLAVDSAGNVFVTGHTNNGMSNDILTIKYGNDLAFKDLVFFNAGNAETAASVTVDSSDNIYVAGYADGSGQQNLYGGMMMNVSAIGLKYDNDLILRSSVAYSQGNNYGKAVAVDAAGAAYIMGSYNAYNSQGLRIIKSVLADNSKSLTVAVGTATPRVGFSVGLIPFPTGGSPDISYMAVGKTDSSGKFTSTVRPGVNYLVALSSPGFSPTVKDQIGDPLGKFMVRLAQPTTKQYYLNPIPAANQGSTLSVALTGLVTGYYVMGEVFFMQTGERVAYGVFRATAATGTMEIYNVPPSAASMLSLNVSVPARLSVTVPIPFSVPYSGYLNVDMTYAMPPQGTYQVGLSTAMAFAGFVGDAQGVAIKDVRIRISSTAACAMGPCPPPLFQAETFSDVNGRFVFQTVPWPQQYSLNITKAGYKIRSEMVDLTTSKPNEWYLLEKATYTLRGYVRYNGTPVPYALVRAWGVCGNSNHVDSYRNQCSAIENKVYTDGDGQFLLEGMPDGNVRLDLNEPIYASINDGPDGIFSNADDLRIVISSSSVETAPTYPLGNPCTAGRAWVLDSSGTCKGVQPYVFNLGNGTANTGSITGYVTFTTTYTVTPSAPLIIDKSSAVVIVAQEDCDGNCQQRKVGFAVVYGTFTTDTTTYSIGIASNAWYWINVLSNEWGKVSSFGGDVDLTSTTTARMDFNLVKAGSLSCKIKLPDGTVYVPPQGQNNSIYINAAGKNISADQGTNLDEYGNAKFPNLPAGIYSVSLRPNTTSFLWPTQTLEDINIIAGRNTDVTFNLENGLAVQPQIFSLPEISTISWSYLVIPLPSGTKMNQKKVTDLFFGRDQFAFNYSTTTSLWETKYMAPGQYDFYLLLGSKYDPGGGDRGIVSYNQFANFIGKAKNVSIQVSESNPNLGTAAQPIPIDITGSIGQGIISGRVKGSKIFTEQDYVKLFASFESEIQGLIPAVMLYDTAGDFRGFSHALPDADAMVGFEDAIVKKSSTAIVDVFTTKPLSYMVWGLPQGRYTAVFANPNYPPVPVNVNLPEDEVKDFDFDAHRLAVGGISGVVRSSGALSEPLPNASVYLKHRTVEKLTKTDDIGAFSFANLPPGIYKIEVSRDGFTTTGQKTSLSGSLSGSDSAFFNFYMEPSTSSITGTVLLGGGLGGATAKAGIRVVAYDETLNTTSPAAYLPKIQSQTDDAGGFELSGVTPGHVYNVSAIYPGKPIGKASVVTSTGVTVLENPIVLTDANPQVTVKIRKSPDSDRKVDVVIKSPKALLKAPRCQYNLGVAYASSTAVSLTLRLAPDNTYVGQFAVSPNKTYNIHVEAFDDNMGDDFLKMVKDVVYDQTNDARTEQYIQEAASEGGEINLDAENEEYSGIELEVGSLTESTDTADLSGLVGGFFSALPSVRTVKTAKGNASIASALQDLMASEVYNFDLKNVQGNKPFTLTLKYDKERGLNSSALRIYQYDAATDSWLEVPGNYTVDPMTGVVSVDVRSLDGAYRGTSGGNTPLERKQFHMSAISGGRYVPSAAATSQAGKFAVFTRKPDSGTAANTTTFEIYNMPNPFNLKSKNVVISNDGATAMGAAGAYSTGGTIIKYHLPAGRGGVIKLAIYNLAGEKVRTLEEGARPGDSTNYSEWDGKNDAGQDCASGVYFMLTYLDGKKLGNKAHKMALIK